MANNNKHTSPNVPALRFPEFSGEWESIKLGDVLKLKGGYAFKSEKFQDSGVPVVRISNLPQNSYSVDLSDCVYYECGNYQNYTVKNGDLLIAMSGATTGKTAIYRYDYPAYLNQRVGLFAPKELVHNQFLYPIVESKTFISQLGSKLVAGAQPNISSQDIETIAVGLPSKEEQIKIAHLFELLNQKIETQTKIIEEHETLLKSLADKLISSQMANMVLNDCVIARASTMKEGELEPSGVYPVFGASGLCGYSNEALEESDSILVTKDGSGVGTCQYATGAHSFLGTLCSLTVKEGVYLPYVYYALLNFNFALFKTGLAIPHIYFKDYGKAVIYCPSYDEQVRIASGLEKIEAKIKSDKELLKLYQLQKEYLLSRMFI